MIHDTEEKNKEENTDAELSGAALALNRLNHAVNEIASKMEEYVIKPGIDFSRQRIISFKEVLTGLMGMGGAVLDRELLDEAMDGMYAGRIPTPSAFSQKRGKVKPKAFEDLFHAHAKTCGTPRTWHGRRVFAADGSDLVYLKDPGDPECCFGGYNKIHLNALYDVCNNIYADVITDSGHETNEWKAAAETAERFRGTDGVRPIMTADRGYEGYNLLMRLKEAGWDYLIRAKDSDSSGGILCGLRWAYEDGGALDGDIRLLLTRCQTKEVRAHPEIYKFLPSKCKFDPPEGCDGYEIEFRIVRVQLPNGAWECLLTNLPRGEFPPEALKELYWMRWGIETSFRLLKNAVCLKNFHSKKRAYIIQEIYARLTMYNFCSESIRLAACQDAALQEAASQGGSVQETAAQQADETGGSAEYKSKPNFTFLAALCMKTVRGSKAALASADDLLRRVKVRTKKNRAFERGHIRTGPVSFQYRMA